MYCNTSPASSTVRKIPEALPSENKRPWSNTRTRAESDNQTQTLGLVLRTDADIRTSDRGVSLVAIQSLSLVQCFVTPWTAARQAPLSSTNSWNLLKFMSMESVMLSNHLVLCGPLLPWDVAKWSMWQNEASEHATLILLGPLTGSEAVPAPRCHPHSLSHPRPSRSNVYPLWRKTLLFRSQRFP